MPNEIQSGTMMVRSAEFPPGLQLETQSYNQTWSSLGTCDSSAFDGRLRAAGWNLFFMADELKAVVPAWGGQKTLRAGVRRLLAQTGVRHFNCMQVSRIVRTSFFGIPYMSIAAHPCHMQRGSTLLPSADRAANSASR
jgi:hypothetical protein